jgi:hypothetical protein
MDLMTYQKMVASGVTAGGVHDMIAVEIPKVDANTVEGGPGSELPG